MKWYQRRVNEFNDLFNYHYTEPISARLHKKFYTCSWCGDLIPDDEVGSPNIDRDNEFMCDECYNDEYRFICPICEDFDEEEECDDIGSIIILTDQEVDVIPGAYEIIKFPYVRWGEPAMENLKKIGNYKSEKFPYDDCWNGIVKICRTCQEEIVKEFRKRRQKQAS